MQPYTVQRESAGKVNLIMMGNADLETLQATYTLSRYTTGAKS